MTAATNSFATGYILGGVGAELIAARLAYIELHGARWLFNNQPPPAPGWPRIRKGKVVCA